MPARKAGCGGVARVLVALLLAGPAGDGAAQEVAAAGARETAPSRDERPAVAAARIPPRQIQLDGRVDEAVWSGVPAITALRQTEPLEGAAASEDTEVRIAYDDHALYVAVVARDREPGAVIARTLVRDRLVRLGGDGHPRAPSDDAVMVLLDPFNDQRNAVLLATNPAGAQFDALITDEGKTFNPEWDGVWDVAARRTEDGWSAELAIPFRSLRYPASGAGRWGINVHRTIRRKNEEASWSAWSRADGFVRVSRAGHLQGLDVLPRVRRNLELRPFVVAGAVESGGADGARDPRLDVGLDAKYEVRAGLTLDATLNPDFAHAEVDDQYVNLTRYSVFLPEKRDFFLENAGIFEFGVRGSSEPPPFLMFFSRRIGIAPQGEVPVVGGLRLTGRAGRQTVGAMQVVTAPAFDEPHTAFTVLRAKRDVGARGYLGAMVTDRRNPDAANSVAGIDGSFWPSRSLNLQGFGARTATRGEGGDGTAYRVGADYQTGRVGVSAQHLYVGPEVYASMGFVTRTDIRRTGAFTRATARPAALKLRRVDGFWDAQYITTASGRLQDWSYGPGVSFTWRTGDNLTLYHLRAFTRVDAAFSLAPEVKVEPGDYGNHDLGFMAATSRNRPLSLSAHGSYSRFYHGRLASAGGSALVARTSHGSLTAGYTHTSVDIPGGSFRVGLASFRASYAVSPRMMAQTLLQHNTFTRATSVNLRFGYTFRAGSDSYLVFNEQRGAPDDPWALGTRGALAKTTYLIRP